MSKNNLSVATNLSRNFLTKKKWLLIKRESRSFKALPKLFHSPEKAWEWLDTRVIDSDERLKYYLIPIEAPFFTKS